MVSLSLSHVTLQTSRSCVDTASPYSVKECHSSLSLMAMAVLQEQQANATALDRGDWVSAIYERLRSKVLTMLNLNTGGGSLDAVALTSNSIQPGLPHNRSSGILDLHFEQLYRENRHEELKKMALLGDANLNKPFKNGKTVLLEAIESENFALAEWLLEQKADPNFAYNGNMTIVQLAAQRQELLPFIPLLLKHGGNIHTATAAAPLTPPIMCKFFFPEKEVNKYFPYDAYTEELLGQRLLAHSFKIDAHAVIKGIPVDLMSGFSPRWSDIMRQSLAAMAERQPEVFPRHERKQLEQFLEKGSYGRLPSDEMLANIEQGVPTMLHSGFVNHNVEVLFFKNSHQSFYMGIANKGDRSRKPYELFQIDRSRLTVKKIEEIQNLRFKPVENYLNWLDDLPETLGVRSTLGSSALEQVYPFLSSQTSKNCSWESFETAVFLEILLSHIKNAIPKGIDGYDPRQPDHRKIADEAVRQFSQLFTFTQFRSIENYIQLHNDAVKETLPINNDLVAKVFTRLAASKRELPADLYPYFDQQENQFLGRIEGRYKEEYFACKQAVSRNRILSIVSIAFGIFMGTIMLTHLTH